jgi:tight adherence protein C
VTAAFLAFSSAALATAGLLSLLESRTQRQPSRKRGRTHGARPAGRLLRFLAAAGAAIGPLRRARAPRDLRARIVAAGSPAGLGPRELMAAKGAAALAGAGAGMTFAPLMPGRLGVVLAVGAPAGGFLLPDLWLVRRARERAATVRRELPGLLDLLRVGVDAGLSLQAAIAAVGARAHGVLAAELRAVAAQLELGVPLSGALSELARRVPIPEVEALSSALERARRHGAPPGEALAAQARDARLARARRIQEDAAKAGPKIQLVVALLLVPSVLLLVAAALAAAMLGDGGGLALGGA